MSLSTFGPFKTALADWAWGEITVAQAADFFTLMQSKMYMGDGFDIPPLRVAAMVATGTLTPNASGQVTISTGVNAGWLQFLSLDPTAASTPSLDYLEPWEFRKRTELQYAGTAKFYTTEGDTLYTGPYSSSSLAASWRQKFTALSGDSDTDWVLTNAPQIYMNGCLMEICAYLQDDREGQFRAKFASAIQAANLNNTIARMSGSVKRAIPRNVA